MIKKASERRLCFMLRKYNIREETSKFTNEELLQERGRGVVAKGRRYKSASCKTRGRVVEGTEVRP